MNETTLAIEAPACANPPSRPPIWLIVSTGVLAIACLVLAVAETNLWAHYLIGGSEFLSLFGLAFIGISGLYLFRHQRLFVSLPLVSPWLLYPIIVDGDQLIDNLSINPMRLICHGLLAAIFGTPVAVAVLAARHAFFVPCGRPSAGLRGVGWVPGLRQMAEGRVREGMGLLAATLMTMEIWIAHQFLGTLMVVTVVLMVLGALVWGSVAPGNDQANRNECAEKKERLAVIVLFAGVLLSAGVHLGFRHRPGAYQGSPSVFMDPTQKWAFYRLDQISVPPMAATMPADPRAVEKAFTSYAKALARLLDGYHILDRNYTYDFHNHLFLRHTPLLTNYRTVGLQSITEARQLQRVAEDQATIARAMLAPSDPLAALLEDVRGYVAFNLNRAPVLERMSGEFERTPAGLQHAAHLYEGESKALGTYLLEILRKHRAILESPSAASITARFASTSHSIYQAYSHHVVGF